MSMPRIVTVHAAVPEHRIDQTYAKQFVRHLFRDARLDIERLLPVFENTQIRSRYFCVPPEWFESTHGFRERNRIYVQNAVSLAARAVSEMLAHQRISSRDISHIFFVSTTGLSTPSIDAHLFNMFDFPANVVRTPIWGLGCAGGVAGLNRASDWLKAYPEKMALVVSLELCGLTFIRNDLSKSNFVATSLFGDGCGVALLAGDRAPVRQEHGIRLTANSSVTWKDSLSVMGWDIADEGLRVVFSRSIPQIVRASAKPAIDAFLADADLSLADIDYFLSHPGGAKVIEAYRETMALNENQTAHMVQVLKHYGNMSSATVFFVLREFLNDAGRRAGAKILTTALGPGFSNEMLLGVCN